MKLLVLLFLLFSTFLALRWKNGIKLKWASGCTFSGITAQTFKVKGEDCGRMCELDYFCTHFTWRKTGGNTELGNCDLMQGAKDLEHIVVDDWSQVCGVMNKTDGGWIPAQDDVMWAKGCELGYTEVLDTKEDIYAYACAPTCIEHPRCTHFMWKSITDDRDTGKCMLLEGYNKEQPKKADKEDVCGFIKTD